LGSMSAISYWQRLEYGEKERKGNDSGEDQERAKNEAGSF